MSVVPPVLAVAKAFVVLIATGTGKPCGLGEPPTDDPVSPSNDRVPSKPPYTIVEWIPGTRITALTFDGQPTEAAYPFQVTYVSDKDARQVLWLMTKTREVVLARDGEGGYVQPMDVPGCGVTREFSDDGGRDREGVIVSSVDRFTLRVSAA